MTAPPTSHAAETPLTEDAIKSALTVRERRRVRWAVHGGDPVWDEASARYAVVVAEEIRRVMVFGRIPHLLLNVAITALFVFATVEAVGDDDTLGTVIFGVLAVGWGIVSILMPFAVGNAFRVREVNAHLLPAGFSVDRPAPSGRARLLAPIGNALGYGVAFGVLRLLFLDASWAEALGAGAFFGIVMSGFTELGRAVERRRAARGT